jgi:hypothetical protein
MSGAPAREPGCKEETMSDEIPTYNLQAIRKLLLEAFTAEDLRRFCQDRPPFRPIVQRFGPHHGFDEMVDKVVDYCQTEIRWEPFLAEVEKEKPDQYARFADRLYAPETVGEARTSTDTPAKQDPEREKLLNKVQARIDVSLHNAVYMALGIEYQHDAVSRPWNPALGPANQPVDPDQSIGALFVAHGCSLLILGEPASGKTITLWQLAEELLAKAQRDESEPIPVVLNLSSWGQAQGSLADWLVDGMSVEYTVPRPITSAWLKANGLALLLDGLDEVDEACRDGCVAAINNFMAECTYQASVVVCSRPADDENGQNGQKRLNLATAIRIQPLTPAQIDAYLDRFGPRLAGLQDALRHDEGLRELAQSPLMLSLMARTYAGAEAERLPTGLSADDMRRQILAAYVRRVFEQPRWPEEAAYDQPQAQRWLAHLARGMARHESPFYIERLQPTWLPAGPARRRYHLLGGLVGMLSVGLILGLIVGLTDRLLGLAAGLVFGAFFGPSVGKGEDIVLRDELHWSPPTPRDLLKEIRGTLIFGLILMLSFWLILGLAGDLRLGLILGLILGLDVGLVGGLNACLQTSQTQQPTRPNQGVRNSLRNALRMCLLYGLLGGLSGALLGGLLGGLAYGPGGGLIVGLGAGLGVGLGVGLLLALFFGLMEYGGRTAIQHYTLRFLLARQGILPFPLRDRRLVAYLDVMAERMLLRRVGGGWEFIHRYLLEYFASLAVEGAQPGGRVGQP